MIAWSLWMELTSVYKSMAENSTATNINLQAYNMRLNYALLLGLLCGLMDHTSVVSGQTSTFFRIPLQVFWVQKSVWKQMMATLVKLL